MQLLLFGEDDLARPVVVHDIDPRRNKTWDLWHCRLGEADLRGARYYAYSVDGPRSGPGRRGFDPDKVLLDPGAREVYFPPSFDREAARHPGPNAGMAPLGVLPRREPAFDWGDDRPPRHDSDTVIYEMHVRGFTRSPTSGVSPAARGTYAGVAEKVPYLQSLGVTTVELLPVQQYDPQEGNYWGYMPLNFFAPHRSYAADPTDPRREFKAMVKALHEAGIAVILDVVYNHTAEGDHTGPTYSFRGIDDATYYLASDDPGRPYRDYSGCGNTLACHALAVRALILDSLRYWVTEMHVDGFRFDLASVLARNPDGSFGGPDDPLLTAIRADPVLREVHLIAEPWDAAGAYQLGTRFPGPLWQQWNGRFRDDVRRFARGDRCTVPALMTRLYGSDDLFPDDPRDARRPVQSINFVTCHDGFTLHDLVSYDRRHNEANGQGNADGMAENFSWNCGWEGTDGVPGDVHRPAAAAGEEPLLPAPAGERDPDDLRRGRVPPFAGRQQQPVQPGQPDDLARLGPLRSPRGSPPVRPAADRLPPGPPDPLPQPVLARRRPVVRGRAVDRPGRRLAQPRLRPAGGLGGR